MPSSEAVVPTLANSERPPTLQREVSAVRQEAINALHSWESGEKLSPTIIRGLRKRLNTCQRKCERSLTRTTRNDDMEVGTYKQPSSRRRVKSSVSPPLSGYMGWMKTRPSAIQSLANISLAMHKASR